MQWHLHPQLKVQELAIPFKECAPLFVTGFEKSWLPRTHKIFRNINFNKLKYCISGRETDACMQFATTPSLFIVYAPTIEWVVSRIAHHFRQFFTEVAKYHKHSYRGGGWRVGCGGEP